MLSILRKAKELLKYDFTEEMHDITLQDSLENAIVQSKEDEKPLIIYLHNMEKEFSKSFMRIITNDNIKNLLNKNFTFFAWEVHNDKANKHLKNIKELRHDLSTIEAKINVKAACLLFFMSYKDEIKLHEILQDSLDATNFTLHCHELNELHDSEKNVRRERLQKECVQSAIKNLEEEFGVNHLPFAANTLDKAIEITLQAQPVVTRKILVLWYYNKDNVSSKQLAKLLLKGRIRDCMQNFFHIVPWDVQNKRYYNVLKDSIRDRFDSSIMSNMIEKKENGLFFFITCRGNQPIYEYSYSLRGQCTEIDLKEMIVKIQSEFVKLYNITDLAELEAIGLFKIKNNYNTLNWLNISNKPLHVTIQEIFVNRKMLVIWFCRSNDNLTKKFVEAVEENIQLIKEHFIIVPWYVSKNKHCDKLTLAIQRYFDVEDMESHITSKTSAMYVYMPIDKSLALLSVIRENSNVSNIFGVLKGAVEIYSAEDGLKLKEMRSNGNDVSAVGFQNEFCTNLSNRDYDCIKLNKEREKDETKYLKGKIDFALYGFLKKSDDEKIFKKRNAKVDALFTKIIKQSQKYAGNPNEIMFRCVYNCIVPFTKEKSSDNANYNPMPLFVIRRCVECPTQNACCIFIDQDERVYFSWQEYLSKNKLPKCVFILPKEGRYQIDMWGNVRLECHLSPECGIGAKVLRGLDVGNTILGLGGTALLAVGLIPTITLAPVIAAGGTTVCGIAGIYSLVRNSVVVQDRISHDENMSIMNSEARGAYFNLATGSLGFICSGATSAITYCAKNGRNIGLIARATINGITGANVLVSGAALGNSSYEIISRWIDTRKTPDSLTIIQLSSSILFFGHAVCNLKTANTIISEAQLQSLKVFKGSLRSNRHRKTFDKFTKETIRTTGNACKGRAEVISYIKKLYNPDEVLALLTRTNKTLHKNGIRYYVKEGQLIFNGIATDILELTNLSKIQQIEYLSNLPPMLESGPIQTRKVVNMITAEITNNAPQLVNTVLRVFKADDAAKELCSILLEAFSDYAKNKLISFMGNFLVFDKDASFQKVYPNSQMFVELLKMILVYFKQQVKKKYSGDNVKDEEEGFINSKNIKLLENIIIASSMSISTVTREIIKFSVIWIGRTIIEMNEETDSTDTPISKKRTACKKCKGLYYV